MFLTLEMVNGIIEQTTKSNAPVIHVEFKDFALIITNPPSTVENDKAKTERVAATRNRPPATGDQND